MKELTTLTPAEFARFRALIYQRTGISTADGKVTLLSNRIRRRLRHLGVDTFAAYYDLLVAGRTEGEWQAFIDAITTNETFFFRSPEHLAWLAGPWLDELTAAAAARTRGRSIAVWSAAASSGEEAYSVAICLAEAAGRLSGWRLSVLGTDISETAVTAARAGVYGARAVEQVGPERLARHFAVNAPAGTWTIRSAARNLCRFERHNLLDPAPGGPFDCILIRNVLIYFDKASKKAALDNLVAALAPGGHLIVGTTDGAHEHLAALERRSTFAYRKP
ncbi:MAG: protein-glutamate O-methyltransferase CheR [Planctomycetia bacterium]|nr:protein-glutamate O-methyltransferase CheR [Planctomycetia bacterium]